jgi:hypothetical protein
MNVTPADGDAVRAAHDVATRSAAGLQRSVAFRQLPVATQQALLRDLATLTQSFGAPEGPPVERRMAQALGPRRQLFGSPSDAPPPDSAPPSSPPEVAAKTRSATASLAANAGALSDEIDFSSFVAGLVHGTFDAMVDASIRQMETYADLVATVARGLDDFTRDNVSRGQVIDWLSERYPRDLQRDVPLDGSGEPRLLTRAAAEGEDERQPAWLADFGIEDEALSDDLIEERLIPAARRAMGESRLKSLATMVLLGLNRIVVRDGTISARVRFRAAAKDAAKVAYASGQEPGTSPWSERGGYAYTPPATMVSTVGVNVQAESDLKVELFGEVKINFASETLPLDRFASAAQIQLLESHAARPAGTTAAGSPAASPPPAPAPAEAPPVPAGSPAPPAGGPA